MHSPRTIAAVLVAAVLGVAGDRAVAAEPGAADPAVDLLVRAVVPRMERPYTVHVWQMEDGLPQNGVTAIVQTRDGYLWVGTYGGVVRFDGVRFTVFDVSATPGLQNNRVTGLFEDAGANLWIDHEGGELTRLAEGRFHAEKPAVTAGRESVIALEADAAGGLWMVNRNGQLEGVTDGRVVLPGVRDLQLPGSAALARDGEGALWIARSGAVSRLAEGRLGTVAFDPAAADPFVLGLAGAREGGLWVLMEGRVRRWKDGRWVEDRGRFAWGTSPVTAMAEMRNGSLAVGTLDQGLYLVPPDQAVVHYSRTNGLPHDWVRCLREDREGNLWLGAGSGGLVVLRPARVSTLDAPDHWQGRAVLSLTSGRDGALWVSTEGAGLYRYQNSRWSHFGAGQGLLNPFVWSVAEDEAGRIWAGTWGGGLMVRRGERFEPAPGLEASSIPVLALFPDRDRRELWVGTGAGLWCYRDGAVTRYGRPEGVSSPDVRAVTRDGSGTLWFGMFGGGLGRIHQGELRQFRRADGLSSDFVQCLLPDADGTLWIGTADNGLCRLKDGRFAEIGRGQQLPSHVICHLADDGRGFLWMSTHGGLVRVAKSELNRCANGETRAVRVLTLGRDDGLPTVECSGGLQPAGCRTPDGRLWFTSTKGLVGVDPANIQANPLAPPVVIEEVRVEDVVLEAPGATRDPGPRRLIPAGRQRFEFSYTALSFAAPEKVLFRYQLVGLETGWVEAGTKREASYSHLAPGEYTFRATACNNDGVWAEAGAAWTFEVLPYIWQTWWFRALAGAGAVGLVGAGSLWVVRRRMSRALEHAERQHAIERERARIARDIHDDLGASLTRITLLSQSARADLNDPAQTAVDLDRICGTALELTRAMDEIVWAVNPQHDTLDSLASYLGKFAQDFLGTAGLRCRLDMPFRLPPWPLTAETRHNLFLAFKESLNNTFKHAEATEVQVSLALATAGFTLSVQDDGVGFEFREPGTDATPPDARPARGNGLRNMRRRLAEIGGRCEIHTRPGEGTGIRFVVPAPPRTGAEGPYGSTWRPEPRPPGNPENAG